MTAEKPSIAIIGAGLGGLTAAASLVIVFPLGFFSFGVPLAVTGDELGNFRFCKRLKTIIKIGFVLQIYQLKLCAA